MDDYNTTTADEIANFAFGRSLAEKQARMRTIADAIGTLRYLTTIGSSAMGDFSQEEAQAFHDTVDALNHFVTLASVNT